MSMPDFGDDDVGSDRAHARDGAEELGGLSKRLEPEAHLLLDGGDGPVQGVDVIEVHLEHEAVMCADVAAQGFEHLGTAGLDPQAHAGEQLFRIGLSADDGLQDCPATLAREVAEHNAELEIGVLQDLFDALHVGAALTHELLARAGEGARFLHRHGRHETGADQPMGEQIGEPHGVVDVGLAPGHVLDVRGVGQHQLEVPFEDVPDGLPVHARGFHAHLLDALGIEPVGQGEQARGGRGERAHFLRGRPVPGNAYAGDHGLLGYVQPSAAPLNDIHDGLRTAATSACGPRHRTLGCVLRGAKPRARVRGARGAAGPTDIRACRTKYKPTSVPDAALLLHSCFVRRGSREARWSN
jgi:hypothetical protein